MNWDSNEPKRIIFFGRETYSWWFNSEDNYLKDSHDPNELVEQLTLNYREFKLGANYYSSPFWDFCHKTYQFLTGGKSKTGFMWNNISKIDEDKRTPEWEVQKAITNCYRIIEKEIGILNPDIVIFLTGPSADEYLNYLFDGVKFVNGKGNILSKLEHLNLPSHTYRTYHLKYLRMKGKTVEVQELLVQHIRHS